jgi:CRISPR-associated protein Csb1
VSGGAKINPIDPTGKLRAKEYDKDVYGNVPFQRVEFVADQIKAYFNIDIGLIRSYALGEEASELLIALAFYKIGSFLDGGTRLRTACDLKKKTGVTVTDPADFTIPSREELLACLGDKIKSCKAMFADPPVTLIQTPVVLKKSKEQDI